LRGVEGSTLARGLHLLGAAYGKLPHELLEIDDVHFAFDWAVLTRQPEYQKQ
jgi:hypothetical protein